MNELEVLKLFITEIESVVDVPVKMSQTDENHEAGLVLIDSLDTNRELRATNPYAGLSKNEDGDVVGETLRLYHDARLDLKVGNEDEVEAYKIRQAIKEHFYPFETNPRTLDEDIVLFEVGDGGKREAEFEPSVFRFFRQTQSFHFEFSEVIEADAEVLEEIEDNL